MRIKDMNNLDEQMLAEALARGQLPDDVFNDVEEYNYNMEVGRGILALKSLREAVVFITEYGGSHGFDHEIRDGIIELLLDEQQAVASEIIETWHHIKIGKQDGDV